MPELGKDLEATLAHYGIPGMKWGVRKRRDAGKSASSEPTDVVIKSKPGKIEVSGGKNQPPSEDAKKAAAYRQKARASSVHSLTNQEIQALVQRMKLEAEYAKVMAANAPQKNLGRRVIDNFISSEKDTVLKGQKPKTVKFVEAAISLQKSRKAKVAKAAAGAAATAAASKAARNGARGIASKAGAQVVQSYVVR